MSLCQACMMCECERIICLPIQDEDVMKVQDREFVEYREVERDLGVCFFCYDRISNAITQGLSFRASIVGNRILGLHPVDCLNEKTNGGRTWRHVSDLGL